jgi:hypothetical protein
VHVALSRRLRRVEAEDGWVDAMATSDSSNQNLLFLCIRT